MAPKFYGPYQITKKISQVEYKLQLPDKSHTHNIFHVSCLKKMLGKHQTVQTILPMFVDERKDYLGTRGNHHTQEIRLRS